MARLVNVRLDDERVEKARRLRQRGIALSDEFRSIWRRPDGSAIPLAVNVQAAKSRIQQHQQSALPAQTRLGDSGFAMRDRGKRFG